MNESAPISSSVLPDAIFEALPQSIRSYIRNLETTVQQQAEQLHQLKAQINELETRLSKNSSNSGKPPSSDGLKRKTKSQRKKSGKKSGGQKGHMGKGLAQVTHPDVVVNHEPISCSGCGFKLDAEEGLCVEKRQVFEIPQPKVEVTEHCSIEKECSYCGKRTRGSFPEEVKGPVQYGDRIQALIAYYSHQHFIPIERVCEIFEAIHGISLSSGTCANVNKRLFEKLEAFEVSLKTYLLNHDVLHFDETGMRCEKRLHWLHATSSKWATLYTIHQKRGKEAMNVADILPRFQGTAVHDHWAPYFSFEKMTHALCNAHHLRELIFVHEQEKEEWAKEMYDLLIEAKKKVETHFNKGALSPEIVQGIEERYKKIVEGGLAYHAQLPPLPKGKRGRQKQRSGKNFLDRLQGKRDCVLRFTHDFAVPFTNNLGEQDIRMAKLKQKIAGCFRTLDGGEVFCRARSYISTARKQGWNIWEALANAIRGSPCLVLSNVAG